MATIVEALKKDSNFMRIDHDDRWLFWDHIMNIWIVRTKKPYQRGVTDLLTTENEEKAVEMLLTGKEA